MKEDKRDLAATCLRVVLWTGVAVLLLWCTTSVINIRHSLEAETNNKGQAAKLQGDLEAGGLTTSEDPLGELRSQISALKLTVESQGLSIWCPETWIASGLDGSCLFWPGIRRSFHHAREVCQALNSCIATAHSAAELAVLKSLSGPGNVFIGQKTDESENRSPGCRLKVGKSLAETQLGSSSDDSGEKCLVINSATGVVSLTNCDSEAHFFCIRMF